MYNTENGLVIKSEIKCLHERFGHPLYIVKTRNHIDVSVKWAAKNKTVV